METSPVTCRTLEEFYHIDGHTFEKQYKEVLSGFRHWKQWEHAEQWLLFPDNIGTHLAIDESSLSAIKGVNQVVTRFTPFFTPQK